jgi:SAM-dependent methyltransferase
MKENFDKSVVQGFGQEWSAFDQSSLSQAELTEIFNSYFAVFPWDIIKSNAVGFDLGCGSGRWAKLVAPRVGTLHCIDPSYEALAVAKSNLIDQPNCVFHNSSVDAIPIEDESADFGYSLGVLHHVPQTLLGIQSCASKLKPGAPFLIYLYYAFDNKPAWYQWAWKTSDLLRVVIARLPFPIRYLVSQVIACLVYWPLAKLSLIVERIGLNPENMPLSAYRYRSFYVLRTDALDRFGTRLEQRFSKQQILQMMEASGLKDIKFNDSIPYWCAVGIKK